MAGVSLVTADNWIIAHFASSIGGAVSLMSYAKQVFTAPMSMLAQAAGAASMPFFASLWTRDRRYEFATGVADSVSRVASLGLLAASVMVALGWPAIDLVFTGGRFSPDDARLCSAYFAIFSVSLFLWSAQAIYSRAFYAAGNTFVPMVASTIVTVVSLPIYDLLFHWRGAMGLALASDIGIALQTLTIALLLHKRRMVSLASLDYAEMGRCLLGALCWRRGRVARCLDPRRPVPPSAAPGRASSRTFNRRRGDSHWRHRSLDCSSPCGFSIYPARRCPASPCVACGSAELPPRMALLAAELGAPCTQAAHKNTSAPRDAEALVLDAKI